MVFLTPYHSSNTNTLLNLETYFKPHCLEEVQKVRLQLTSCTEYNNVVTITVLPQVWGTITPTTLLFVQEVPPLNVVREL